MPLFAFGALVLLPMLMLALLSELLLWLVMVVAMVVATVVVTEKKQARHGSASRCAGGPDRGA